MKKLLVAVLFGVLLVLGACGGGDDTGSSDGGDAVAVDGENLYQKNCAGCHGKDLSGTAGPDISKVGSDHSADDIQAIIENGQGTMPAGLLKGDDAKAVADWLATHK